jgi:hypothetical protein
LTRTFLGFLCRDGGASQIVRVSFCKSSVLPLGITFPNGILTALTQVLLLALSVSLHPFPNGILTALTQSPLNHHGRSSKLQQFILI